MEEMLSIGQILFGVAIGVAGTFAAIAIERLVALIQEFSRQIVRVRWNSWLGKKLFRDSFSVYSRIHQDLRDDFVQVEAWLAEQAEIEEWQEIYLVARGIRHINGVLYASLYPNYECMGLRGPLCVVNCVVANTNLSNKRALAITHMLWKRLVKDVSKWTNKSHDVCHYFFEFVRVGDPPRGGTFNQEDEKRRRAQYHELLREIGAQRVVMDYVIPDMKEYHEENEIKASLAHFGPHLLLNVDEILKFIYGFHYFWEFEFGSTKTNVIELSKRVEYVQELILRIRGEGEKATVLLRKL